MRVEGAARAQGAEAQPPRFGEALARAGGRERGQGTSGRTEEARSAARDPRAAKPPARPGAPGAAEAERGAGAEAGRGASAAEGAGPRVVLTPDAPVPELASLARVLPVAVSSLPAGGAPLALSFGRALDVELRSTAAGVDVVLRPAPGLVHAAQAELPRLVAALRVRGVTVARAEVRPRGAPGARAR